MGVRNERARLAGRGKIREGGKKDKEKDWKKLLSPRAGSLGIVIRAGSAANEDNGIKVFDSFPKPGVQKLIVNSIVAISTWEGRLGRDRAMKRMYIYITLRASRERNIFEALRSKSNLLTIFRAKDVATIGNFGPCFWVNVILRGQRKARSSAS